MLEEIEETVPDPARLPGHVAIIIVEAGVGLQAPQWSAAATT